MKKDWTYKKLGEVVYYPTDRVSSSNIDESNYVGVDNLVKDKGGKEVASIIPSEGNCIEYKKGDVLIGNIRPYLKKIWLADINGGASGDVLVLRANDSNALYPGFLYWSLANDSFFEYDMLHSKGAKMPRGSKVDILKYEIPVPSYAQQQKIVSELDLLSGVIEKQKAQIKELDKLAQSIFYDMFGDPITNEKGWHCSIWDDCLTIQNGKNQSQVEDQEGLYPICGSGGIMSRANDYICPENTVIIGRKGNIDNPIIMKEKFWIVDTAFGLVSKEQLKPDYLFYFCKSFNFQKLNVAVTIPSLRKTDLLKINMPLPPLALQQEFAAKVEAIEAMKAKVRQSLKEAETLFNSRMDYYFN